MPDIVDVRTSFLDSPDGLVIKKTQEIPDEFLDDLADYRADTISTPAGEFHRVASVPVVLVEQWKREGFDISREPVRKVLERLRAHDLSKFITTNKRI